MCADRAAACCPAVCVSESPCITRVRVRPARSVNWKGSKKKKVKGKKEGQDLYALLGLQNERWTATEKQVKDGG